MPLKKILVILPEPWYIANSFDYIARYLSSEYYFDLAPIPWPQYRDFKDHYPEKYDTCNTFCKNPDDYDLLLSISPGSPGFVDGDDMVKYKDKLSMVVWEPQEPIWVDPLLVAASTPRVERAMAEGHRPYQSVRLGVDTRLFKPYPMIREDNFLHVGFVGKAHSPRRFFKQIVMPLARIKGIRLMVYAQKELPLKEIKYCGGKAFLDRIAGGNKGWPGLPNIYNQLDVLVRVDFDLGYAVNVMQAAACGVPSISTDGGIEHLFPGIIVKAGKIGNVEARQWYYDNVKEVAKKFKEAIVWMRDHPKERKKMGREARKEIEKNWTWKEVMPGWRKFFKRALEYAEK